MTVSKRPAIAGWWPDSRISRGTKRPWPWLNTVIALLSRACRSSRSVLALGRVDGVQGEPLDRRGRDHRLGRPAPQDGGLIPPGTPRELVEAQRRVAGLGEHGQRGVEDPRLGARHRRPA